MAALSIATLIAGVMSWIFNPLALTTLVGLGCGISALVKIHQATQAPSDVGFAKPRYTLYVGAAIAGLVLAALPILIALTR